MSKEQKNKGVTNPLAKKYKTPEEALKHIVITEPGSWGTSGKKKTKTKTKK